MEKTLEEIQRETDTWANQFEKPYFSPLSMVATMTEECGEVAKVMDHLYGSKNKKDNNELKNLGDELGDLLFTIVCIANDSEISLEEAWIKKLEKLYSAYNANFKVNIGRTLEAIQWETATWTSQFEQSFYSPLTMIANMINCCGEVARVMNHLYGDKKIEKSEELKDLGEELGNLLFTIVCIVNASEISLEEIWSRKLDKLYGRDNDRFPKKKDKGHLETKEGLNYRPIVTITPSNRKVPVAGDDLRDLDSVIQKKLVLTENELLISEEAAKDFTLR